MGGPPPGCSARKDVTSQTWPCTATQQSVELACRRSSAAVIIRSTIVHRRRAKRAYSTCDGAVRCTQLLEVVTVVRAGRAATVSYCILV